MKRPSLKKTSLLTAAAFMFALAASVNPVKADWPNDNPTKWVQMPDLETGMNVLATWPKILADDFLCEFSGPITDIHIWGSWLQDQYDPLTTFKLSIHSDVPVGPNNPLPYSHPGPELWSITMSPTAFLPWATTPNEPFYDPNRNEIIGFDTIVWQYNFIIPAADAFHQEAGNIYWLDVQAFVPTTGLLFGWKTSRDHWNDDAVWGDTDASGGVPFWYELRDPSTGVSLDLAFALTTIPEPGTVVLLGLGAGMLVITLRRRAQS